MATAIVCEGGGMRGVFTAGVLQALMEGSYLADALIGVSAGASNGASYVSHQLGRGYRTNVDYCGDKRYLSKRNYLRTGCIFGMDFVFGDIPNRLDPFDFEAFLASPCAYFAGATDMETGKIHYFTKQDLDTRWLPVRASCSLPLLSLPVEVDGRLYLDGGIADPIPLGKALAEGYDHLLVVLTQPRGYVKKPQSLRAWYKRKYKAYPNFVRTMELRHLVYNHTLEKLARLEAEGRATVIAPPAALTVDRFGQDREKLIAGYNTGLACGKDFLQGL